MHLPEKGNDIEKNCEKCGYLLRPMASCCPNCLHGYKPMQNSFSTETQSLEGASDYLEKKHNPPEFETKRSYSKNDIQEYIQPLQTQQKRFDSEQVDPNEGIKTQRQENGFTLTSIETNKKIEFKGDVITTNRGNTDAHNNTISGKAHARFSFKNGQWFIADESSNNLTMVQVKKETPVEKGDLILIGNKVFRFE